MSNGYDYEGMKVLSEEEIKREFFNHGLAGCFRLYNDNTEAAIDPFEYRTYSDVKKALQELDGIGVENEKIRTVTIGNDNPPDNDNPYSVYIQHKSEDIEAQIRAAYRMAPDRLIINNADEYPDFLSVYAKIANFITFGVYPESFFEINFGTSHFSPDAQIPSDGNYTNDISPLLNRCMIRPADNTGYHFAVYELTGLNKAEAIIYGTEELCYEVLGKIEALQARYRDYLQRIDSSIKSVKDELLEVVKTEVANRCDDKGCLQVYWDYREMLFGHDILDAIDEYTDYVAGNYSSLKELMRSSDFSFEDIIEYHIEENNLQLRDEYESDLLANVSSAVERAAKENPLLSELWDSLDWDDRFDIICQSGYEGFHYNTEDLLENSRIHVNVLLATKSELNQDCTTIIGSFGNSYKSPAWNNCSDDASLEKTLDNSLCYLIHQQGYKIEDIYNAIYKGEPTDSKFIHSLKVEINNNPTEYMSQLTVLVELSGSEIPEFFNAVRKGEGYISFSEKTMLGLYQEMNGAGSALEIELEKPFVVPVSMIHRIQVEGSDKVFSPDSGIHNKWGYTVDETYGLVDSAWSDTFTAKDKTGKAYEAPELMEEDVKKSFKEIQEYMNKNKEKKEDAR